MAETFSKDNHLEGKPECDAAAIGRAWLWVLIALCVAIEWMAIFQPSWSSQGFFRSFLQSWRLAGTAPLRDPEAHYSLERIRANLHVRIWVELMLAQAIVCGAMVFQSIKWIVELWGTGAAQGRVKRTLSVLGRVSIFAVVLIRISSSEPPWNMQAYQGRIRTYGTGVMSFAVAAFLMCTMWVIQSRVQALPTSVVVQELVVTYVSLRYKLQVMLSLLSLLLVAGIAELLVRRLMLTTLSPSNIYPSEVIVMRGTEYSILIAVAYLPIHAAVNGVGCRIRDRVFREVALTDAASIHEWSKQRTEVDDALQLRANEWKSFGPGFAIFAPVVIGMLASLVKTH